MRARALCCIWSLLLVVGLHAGVAGAAGPEPGGNVLVVVLDDIGVDKLGVQAQLADAPATPNIDALAARGVLFENAYAPSMCSPSRAAMLTGRLPRRYGMGNRLRARKERFELSLTETSLPEMLERSPLGYRHSAVGKWHLSTHASATASRHPLALGFEWFAGSLANLNVTSFPGKRGDYFRWEKNTNGVLSRSETYATSDTTNDALARIDAMRGDPWFLWVAYNGAHMPLHAPPRELTGGAPVGTDRERFDAMVTALDAELGRLLSGIEPAVLAATTIIVVGDNGTPQGLGPVAGKGSLSEGGIHVPLIVAGPQVRAPGATSEALVHVVDLFATAADIAGVDTSELFDRTGGRVVLDGQSLLPYLADPTTPGRREVVYQDLFGPNGPGPYRRDSRMLRDARYKLVASLGDKHELYDLAGRLDDGPDLLAAGELSPEASAAYLRLRMRLDAVVASLESGREAPTDRRVLLAGR